MPCARPTSNSYYVALIDRARSLVSRVCFYACSYALQAREGRRARFSLVKRRQGQQRALLCRQELRNDVSQAAGKMRAAATQ